MIYGTEIIINDTTLQVLLHLDRVQMILITAINELMGMDEY